MYGNQYAKTYDLRELGSELEDLRALDTEDKGRDEDDRQQELESLEAELGDDLTTIGDSYEPTLIREADFVAYAEELASDIGAIPSPDSSWPLYCIDWERAANDLKMDYTSVTFEGEEWLIRSW